MNRKRIAKRAVIILLIVLAVAFCGVIMGDKAALKDFFENSTPAFAIPDIGKGFIPQGIAYDKETDCFFLTGYMGNGKDSPIYAVRRSDGQTVKKVTMLTENGEKFKGHAGGVSGYGSSLYIAGSTDACMYEFPVESVLNAEDGSRLAAEKNISLRTAGDFIRVSFTSCDDRFLYAGEFHKGFIFYTDKSHMVEDGSVTQKAYLFGFTPDEKGKAVPACVFSIPDSIQGACFSDGYVYLSRSRGLLCGSVLSYNLDKLTPAGTKTVLGREVPLYILSENSADKVTRVPPMCEEIAAADGKLYIVFEAASNRYLIGKAMGLDKVYAVPAGYFQ